MLRIINASYINCLENHTIQSYITKNNSSLMKNKIKKLQKDFLLNKIEQQQLLNKINAYKKNNVLLLISKLLNKYNLRIFNYEVQCIRYIFKKHDSKLQKYKFIENFTQKQQMKLIRFYNLQALNTYIYNQCHIPKLQFIFHELKKIPHLLYYIYRLNLYISFNDKTYITAEINGILLFNMLSLIDEFRLLRHKLLSNLTVHSEYIHYFKRFNQIFNMLLISFKDDCFYENNIQRVIHIIAAIIHWIINKNIITINDIKHKDLYLSLNTKKIHFIECKNTQTCCFKNIITVEDLQNDIKNNLTNITPMQIIKLIQLNVNSSLQKNKLLQSINKKLLIQTENNNIINSNIKNSMSILYIRVCKCNKTDTEL